MPDSEALDPRSGDGGANAALTVHVVAGLLWTLLLTGIAAGLIGDDAGLAWGACVFVLWIRATLAIRDEPDGRAAWNTSFNWWAWSLVAPLALALVALRSVQGKPATTDASEVAGVAARIAALEREVADLRRELRNVADAPHAAPPRPSPARAPAPPPASAPRPTPAPVRPAPAAPAPVPKPRRELDLSVVFSAKALAWVGGAVMALGIVFLFALAVNRGWIGPAVRVVIGGLASAGAFAAGLEVARRYGRLYAAYGAVGAGLVGAYATLLAAAGLYDLVPEAVALVLAGVVAAAGLVVALRWSSEMVAGLGLIGAGLVPVLLLEDTDGPTVLGTSFTAIVLAALALACVARGWSVVLVAGSTLAAVEALGLFASEGEPSVALVVLGFAVWAVLLSTGVAWHLLRDRSAVGPLTSAYVLGSGAFAWWSVAELFADEPQAHRGVALLVTAGVYALVAAPLWRRRDLAILVAIVALSVGAMGVADVLSGSGLTMAWAIEAAALAVAARMLRERRFQLAGLAYLALATAHAFAAEAPLDRLYVAVADPAAGVPSLLVLAGAASVAAFCARFDDVARDEGVFVILRDVFAALRDRAGIVRWSLGAVAALLALDAAGLVVLELAQHVWEPLDNAFAHGHLVLTVAGAALAVAAVALALARRANALLFASLGWLAFVVLKALFFDIDLSVRVWPWSVAASALAVLTVAVLLERRKGAVPLGAELAVFMQLAALGLAVGAADGRLDGDAFSYALLGIAVAYAIVAAAFFGPVHRGFATAAWGSALVVAAVAEARLLDGQSLPILWSGVAVGLVLLARELAEPRFLLGGLGYLAAAAVPTFVLHAPPTDFVRASEHPAAGVPSVLALAVAVAITAVVAARPIAGPRDELDEWLSGLQRILAGPGRWVAGVLGLYAVSLSILELAERVGQQGADADFRGGHTAVSAVWGVLGLALLYLGLRRAPALRVAGFVLFGVSLLKLFAYDLSRLSSITRALSFLAVGAVLLLGGFFYQRLGEDGSEEGPRSLHA